MSIPYDFLQSPSGKSLSNLARKYISVYKKLNKVKANEENPRHEVLKWLFSSSLYERTEFCSIQSIWLVEEMHRLTEIYETNTNVKFKLNTSDENCKMISNLSNLNLRLQGVSHKTKKENEIFMHVNYYTASSDDDGLEKEFLSHLQVISLDETNDTLTLSQELLKDEEKFKNYFSYFTGGDYFSHLIPPNANRKFTKAYRFDFPIWFYKKDYLSLPQVCIAYFELIIMIKYVLTKHSLQNTKDKVINILKDNEKIASFLKTRDKKEIFVKLTLKDLLTKFQIKDEILKQRQTEGLDQLHNSDDLTSLLMKIKWLYYDYNEDKFINHLFYINLKSINAMETLVCKEILSKLHYLYSNHIAKELLEDDLNIKEQRSTRNKKKDKTKPDMPFEENINTKKESIAAKIFFISELIKEIVNKAFTVVNNKLTPVQLRKGNSNFYLYKTNHLHFNTKDTSTVQIQKEQRNSSTPINDNDNIPPNGKENILKAKEFNIEGEDILKKETSATSFSQIINNEIQIINQVTYTYKRCYKKRNTKGRYFNKQYYQPHSYRKPYYCYTNCNYSWKKEHLNGFRTYGYPHFFYDPVNRFYEKFHYEILKYTHKTIDTLQCLFTLRECVINKVKDIIRITLHDHDIIIIHYGSYATNLNIESSDIDIGVKIQTNRDEMPQFDAMITALVGNLGNSNLFDDINPIYSATVPVIKLVANLNNFDTSNHNNFKNSFLYLGYPFNYEELEKIKIDITLNEHHNIPLPSEIAVDIVRNSLIVYPEIQPIILVIKRLLKQSKLNNCFNGGLSSYATFLLILAYIKVYRTSALSLGHILLNLLEFYSNFNFMDYCIDINSHNPFILISSKQNPTSPLILDPVTYLNVSKSTYRMNEVQTFFKEINEYLQKKCWDSYRDERILDEIFHYSSLRGSIF